MKFALIGQDIPMLLPSLLTDLLFAGKEGAAVAVHEGNQAMRGVLTRYAKAIIRRSGLPAAFTAEDDRLNALRGADCVIYAGDCMPASRFRQDREALMGNDEDDEQGLLNQARINGGIGGLLHTLRAGEYVLTLCEEMRAVCPQALVINLGQPLARTTALFTRCGFRTYALGKGPIRGANGLLAIAQALRCPAEQTIAVAAGLPDFCWLLSLETADGMNWLPEAVNLAHDGKLGRLTQRWLNEYEAVAVGDIPAHAELLPEQEDFMPEARPVFGETVEQRKERILHMNTVGEKGASSPEGAAAQGMLLMKAPAIRPVQLALAVLRGESIELQSVIRMNGGALPQLPREAIIEAPLTLQRGQELPHGYRLPEALAELCIDVDSANRLAALAATGDRSALRECVETDPALKGLDHLYCEDVIEHMIALHSDVIVRL